MFRDSFLIIERVCLNVEQMIYKIKFLWDEEAAVWIATSEDVPGLVLESSSFDALLERARNAVPELIELNGHRPDSYKLSYITEREDKKAAYS